MFHVSPKHFAVGVIKIHLFIYSLFVLQLVRRLANQEESVSEEASVSPKKIFQIVTQVFMQASFMILSCRGLRVACCILVSTTASALY